MQELKITLNLYTILINSLENNAIIVDYLGLPLKLIIFPNTIYFITISIGLR